MQVVIIGAGKTGRFLAEKLKGQHAITVIEQRLDVTEKLRAAMPSITVVHGDADEPSVLEYAGVAHADLLAALTGDDEDNLVASFLAKTEFGVPVVFARVNHPANEWMFTGDWGVDVAVSSASLITSLVEKEISLGDIVQLLLLQAENLAIEEVVLPAGSPVVGLTLTEVMLPEGTRIMAVINDSGVTVAQGDTLLSAGDRILLLANLDDREAANKALGLRERSSDDDLVQKPGESRTEH
jgi:trk system potassium uptake protein TrkA